MKIDEQTIEKVANLARIAIKEEDKAVLSNEMSKILTFMEQLNTLNTDGVEPLVYMNEMTNVWREDLVNHEISTAEGLKNSAQHNTSFFLVPKIIEK